MFMFKVNRVDLLRRSIRPFVDMGDRANINYSPDFIMLSTANSDNTVTALLLIQSEGFEFFRCDQQEGCVGINPRILYNLLNLYASAEWSFTVYGDNNAGIMRLYFRNDTRGIRTNHEINFLGEAPYARLDIRQLGFEFTAAVGVPSREFRNNLVLLSAGVESMVNVYITHNLLRLSNGNIQVVLTMEMGECMIVGMAENDQPIEFSFSSEQMAAYQNASLVSSIVWIITPDLPDGPFWLYCPFGLLRDILFLFPPAI